MAITPSPKIIEGWKDISKCDHEIARLEVLLEQEKATRSNAVKRVQSEIKRGVTLTYPLLDAICLHHDADMSAQENYEKLATLYKKSEGEPFGILQFWQSRGNFNSGSAAAFTAPNTHWHLYVGIAKGELSFVTGELRPSFPVERYGFAESVHGFSFNDDFKIIEGPMQAAGRVKHDSKLHYPSGLYDWTKVIPSLKEHRRKEKELLCGYQMEQGYALFSCFAFSKEGVKLLADRCHLVPGYGELIYVDELCRDNIRWVTEESLKKCRQPQTATA